MTDKVIIREVRLTKARTFELDPAKKYIIQVKEGVMPQDDVEYLAAKLDELGIKNAVVVFVPKGKSLKIAETK